MGNLSEDVRQRRLKSIGHKMKGYYNDCRIAMMRAPEGGRRQGRPRTTWRRTAEKERKRAAWRSWSDLFTAVPDRTGWQQSVQALHVHVTWHGVVG